MEQSFALKKALQINQRLARELEDLKDEREHYLQENKDLRKDINSLEDTYEAKLAERDRAIDRMHRKLCAIRFATYGVDRLIMLPLTNENFSPRDIAYPHALPEEGWESEEQKEMYKETLTRLRIGRQRQEKEAQMRLEEHLEEEREDLEATLSAKLNAIFSFR